MATVKIDNVELTNKPAHVLVKPQSLVTYPGPGLGKVVVKPQTPPMIELSWGPSGANRAIVAELESKIGSRIVHMLSFTNEVGGRLRHRNVAVPEIGYGQRGSQNYIDPFTVVFEEIRPMPSLVLVELSVEAVAVGDGKAKWEAPAGGVIHAIGGSIETLGTGAGTSVDIQISKGTTDYLSAPGTFEVNSATNLLEGAVLAANPTFDRGDTVELDIDAISTGPSDMHIYLYVRLFAV